MSVIPLILAAGSLPALIFGAPVPSIPSYDVQSFEKREATTAYTVFGGDGDVSEGWPSIDDWVSSVDDMITANQEVLSSSCSQWGAANNSPSEISDLTSAIKSVSSSTGVDARFILAIVMQESNGCVRAPTTNYGVTNPGLMQSHDGSGTCNSGGSGTVPCPSSEITQMITDGTAGTSSGPGLKQLIAQAASTDATQYYIAARLYNSGSVASGGNLGQGIATHCYASDVANRLIGWSNGPSSCQAGTIGDLTSAVGSFVPGGSGGSGGSSATSPPPASSPTAASTTSSAPTTSATPTSKTVPTSSPSPAPSSSSKTTSSATATATPPPPSAPSTSSDPVYPGAVSSCQKYTSVTSGDYCLLVEGDAGITASQFMEWNSGLDAACSNLWLGYQYCVQA